jgi:hypothetical protein
MAGSLAGSMGALYDLLASPTDQDQEILERIATDLIRIGADTILAHQMLPGLSKMSNLPSMDEMLATIGDKPPQELLDKLTEALEMRRLSSRRLLATSQAFRQHFAPNHTVVDTLHRSALVLLVSYFELLVADVARLYYRRHPKSLPQDDSTISLADLSACASVEEAIAVIIDAKVDALMRGSVETWNEFLNRQLKVDLKKLPDVDWLSLREHIERRNIIIHNDGTVNSLYLTKTSEYWSRPGLVAPTIGTKLDAPGWYIDGAMDLIFVTGLGLIDSVSKKLKEDEQIIERMLESSAYNFLLSCRWRAAEILCNQILSRPCTAESSRLTAVINRWLAIKRQGRWAEIKEEVERFDTKACNPRFAIAVHSLCENPDAFFSALPAAVSSGVTLDEVESWPALDEMRNVTGFQEHVSILFPVVLNRHEPVHVQPEVNGCDDSDPSAQAGV